MPSLASIRGAFGFFGQWLAAGLWFLRLCGLQPLARQRNAEKAVACLREVGILRLPAGHGNKMSLANLFGVHLPISKQGHHTSQARINPSRGRLGWLQGIVLVAGLMVAIA